MMLQSTTLIPVRYAETDQMGVVHHSHYPVYFEHGRSIFFEQHLLPYAQLEAEGLFAPVLDYRVALKGRLGYGDTLRLEVFPTLFRGIRVGMGYRGYRQESLVVEGESLHALTGPDLQAVHPRRLPSVYGLLEETFRAALEPS